MSLPSRVPSSGLTVREAPPSEYAAIEEFVRGQTAHPLWYDAAWQAPLAAYGLTFRMYAAWQGGEVRGVLPLVIQRSLFFGRRAVSVPWADAAGLLSADQEAANALLQSGVGLLKEWRLQRLLLRQPSPLWDWPVDRSDKLAMQLRLTADPETLWKSFDPKVRNQVRKSEKSGVVTETLTSDEGLDGFFEVYSRNMRDLGSPGHSRRYFAALLGAFSRQTEVHVARCDGQVVGAGLTMLNGSRLEIPWASSLQEYNRHCVNHSLYWHILSRACRAGQEWFYFGRSTRGSGPHHFKKQWGAEEVPLYWYSLDAEGRPQVSGQAPRDSFGMAVRIWKQLPLGLTRVLGPLLISQLD
ncbi:MAG: FemAB family XrtA/PEP-CTERM system-associated protein [Planctomycetaceae bacterium]